MSRRKSQRPPNLRERIARLASFGAPLSIAPDQMVAAMSRVDPRTERAIAGKPGVVAVIPVRGVIVPREDRMSSWFGECGVENVVMKVRAAVSDKGVKAVILDVDSPGGSTFGLPEAVAELREICAGTDKPVIAHADFLMASAAYHLAVGADEINASPSALVGNVGVLYPYADEQKMWDEIGIKFTSFAMPDDKGDGWGLWDNTEKFAARRKQEVKETYERFVSDILASREVTKEAIREDWAGAYNAPRAKLLGMIDKVRSIAETFSAYTQTGNAVAGMQRRKLQLMQLKGVSR